jgi:hypothetical protein
MFAGPMLLALNPANNSGSVWANDSWLRIKKAIAKKIDDFTLKLFIFPPPQSSREYSSPSVEYPELFIKYADTIFILLKRGQSLSSIK